MEDEAKTKARESFFKGNPISRMIRRLGSDQSHKSDGISGSEFTSAANKRRAQGQYAQLDTKEATDPEPIPLENNYAPRYDDNNEPNWESYAHEGVSESIRTKEEIAKIKAEERQRRDALDEQIRQAFRKNEPMRALKPESKAKHMVGGRYSE